MKKPNLKIPVRAMVLSSGGIDSTTCLAMAVNDHGKENVVSASFFYGQKHDKELDKAKEIAEYYGVKHYVLDISKLLQYSDCSLLKGSSQEIENLSYSEQINKTEDGMVSTYVPFRNGLMMSSAATLALSLFPDDVTYLYLGAHADDAAGNAYADCSQRFTSAMSKAILLGTYEKVRTCFPLILMNKTQVVKEGIALNAPYHLTWSCYTGEEKQCGICGTCRDRKHAFEANGIEDPVGYTN